MASGGPGKMQLGPEGRQVAARRRAQRCPVGHGDGESREDCVVTRVPYEEFMMRCARRHGQDRQEMMATSSSELKSPETSETSTPTPRAAATNSIAIISSPLLDRREASLGLFRHRVVAFRK